MAEASILHTANEFVLRCCFIKRTALILLQAVWILAAASLYANTGGLQADSGSYTLVIDRVPLKTPLATQYILDSAGRIRVSRYEPGQLRWKETRRGNLTAGDAVLQQGRILNDLASLVDASPGMELLEDDTLRVIVWHSSGPVTMASTPYSLAPASLRRLIDSIAQSAADLPLDPKQDAYLRCSPVHDAQWDSVKTRGTQRLHSIEELPTPAALAIESTLKPVGAFAAILRKQATQLESLIEHGSLLVSYEIHKLSCELYWP